MDYKDICAALENGSMVPGDNATVVAIGGFYAHNADLWISYESTESLVGKVCHAVDDVLAECQSVCCVYSTTSLKYTRFTYIRWGKYMKPAFTRPRMLRHFTLTHL